jgi:hypothetical protein
VKTFDSAIDKQDEHDARVLPEGATGSLFSGRPVRGAPGRKLRGAPELTAARVLCRQLARKRVSTEKKRIVHLICLNRLTVLKRGTQEA